MALKKPIRSLLKRDPPKSKYKRFSDGVDALKSKRVQLKDPNFGRPRLKGRKFTPEALEKVSERRVNRFENNLGLYGKGSNKAPDFPGIHGASGRKLSKKALSKVTPNQLKKFDKRKIK